MIENKKENGAIFLSLFANWYLPAGVLIGMFSAAPIGPVNVLVIQRVLQRGIASALVLGFGAAAGDAFFACISALGLGFIKSLLHTNQHILRFAGGVFMIGFGIFIWQKLPDSIDTKKSLPQAKHMAIAIFIMTLTNPATILWFITAFAMFRFKLIGNSTPDAMINSSLLVLGVFLGSMLWWLGLSSFIARWRANFSDRHLLIMNHVAAGILIIVGMVAIITTNF